MYGKNFDLKKKEGIIEKISHERCTYESVDDRSTLWLYLKYQRKTKLMH